MLKRSIFLSFLMATTGVFAVQPSAPLTPVEKGQALIEKLTHQSVDVKTHFPAEGGLIGYVIQPKGHARGSLLYTDSSGEYLISGVVVNDKGQNLTQAQTEKYINAPLIPKMFSGLEKLDYLTEGKDSAPHKFYVFFDPNCSVCHGVFGMLQPKIDAGELQIRWVPVGIMQPSSVGKAAAILMGKTNEDRVALLKEDEMNFDTAKESGGIKALSLSTQDSEKIDPAVQAAFDRVKANNQYFVQYGFDGTPVFFIQYQTGEKKFFPGLYPGGWLSEQVNQSGLTWS